MGYDVTRPEMSKKVECPHFLCYNSSMPRTARASVGGICYHVINRGNGGATVFHKPQDYEAFAELIGRAVRRSPMRVLAFCVMPNHFHLVLWPLGDGDLGRWMQWLMTSHVRRYHRHYGTSGHVWQGRFKAFPIQDDNHLLTVMRYVERNPVRANLSSRAQNWRWSSCFHREGVRSDHFLSTGPIDLPPDWLLIVNQDESQANLEDVRRCVNKGRPFGDRGWVERIARRLHLDSTLRSQGRPRKG